MTDITQGAALGVGPVAQTALDAVTPDEKTIRPETPPGCLST